MADFDINHSELLLKLAEGQASMSATMSGMKESMEKGFHYFKEQNEAVHDALALKATELDVKELTENYQDLDRKVTRILTIGGTLNAIAAFLVAGLTAWFTKHP